MIDLHVHSTCSDGVLSPIELVELAKKKNIHVMAFTDHNCMRALNEVNEKPKDIRFFYGIELTAFDQYERHFLGYFSNDVTDGIECFLNTKRELFTNVITNCLDVLVRKGYILTPDDMVENEKYSAKKLCQSIWEKGYTDTLEDAYELAFGLSKQKYRCLWQADPAECIRLITSLGGCPILAHPGHYDKQVSMEEMKKYCEYGLLGVECFHPEHTKEHTSYYLDICQKMKLYVTGGSDFHGDIKHPQKLGELRLTEERCQDFLRYMDEISEKKNG